MGWNGAGALQWCHNERDAVSNHQRHHCLLNHICGHRSKKTSKLRITGLCAGNSPATSEFPTQRASNVEKVSIWWCHHGLSYFLELEKHNNNNYYDTSMYNQVLRVECTYIRMHSYFLNTIHLACIDRPSFNRFYIDIGGWMSSPLYMISCLSSTRGTFPCSSKLITRGICYSVWCCIKHISLWYVLLPLLQNIFIQIGIDSVKSHIINKS